MDQEPTGWSPKDAGDAGASVSGLVDPPPSVSELRKVFSKAPTAMFAKPSFGPRGSEGAESPDIPSRPRTPSVRSDTTSDSSQLCRDLAVRQAKLEKRRSLPRSVPLQSGKGTKLRCSRPSNSSSRKK